jgi:uncharacterized protein YdeI (YjbR/CyaY-like superfamily)
MKVRYFRTPADLERWFAEDHASAEELWVGYHKKDSGKPSVTWPESVDAALCVGWIDGIRKKVDEISYTIRFTARRSRSIWSAVNIKRASALIEEGRMRPAGAAAFELRQENRSGIYAYEQRRDQLDPPYAKAFKKNRAAWAFFQAQPPSYRKVAIWWVVSAKKEETRRKHLATLIEDSAKGKRLGQLTRKKAI